MRPRSERGERLVRAMGGRSPADEPRDILTRQTAALALARAGDKNALGALSPRRCGNPGACPKRHGWRCAHTHRKRSSRCFGARRADAGTRGTLGDLQATSAAASSYRPWRNRARRHCARRRCRARESRSRDGRHARAKRRPKREAPELRLAAARVLAAERDAEAPRRSAALLAEPSLVGDALDIALDAPVRPRSGRCLPVRRPAIRATPNACSPRSVAREASRRSSTSNARSGTGARLGGGLRACALQGFGRAKTFSSARSAPRDPA